MSPHRHHWEQRWESSTTTCTFKVFGCDCRQFKGRHYGCHGDAEMRQGQISPEVREQVRRALEVAQSWIRSQESGDPAKPSILVELATALDALKGAR